ncbi:MAG: hypothetical protein WCF61_04675 [Terriglobales bacterium]
MNGKSFVVITLFVVACSFASAQTFGFASVGGGQYCNYEQLIPGGGNTYGGIDNLSACGLSIDSVIAGFGTKLDATDSNGYTVSGAGVTYGDSIYSVVDGDNQSEWAVWTSLTTSKQKDGIFHGKLGWVGVANITGFVGGTNQGYLFELPPNKKDFHPTLGTAALTKGGSKTK